MKTIKLMFTSSLGKNFNVSMNYASPELTGEGGGATVQAAIDALMLQQPFETTLVESRGAEMVEKTVTPIVLA